MSDILPVEGIEWSYVDKVYCDWYLTRLQVLVTTACSETFIVGALQKCLSCCSSGHCVWDLCCHWFAVHSNMHRLHNSCFLVPALSFLIRATFSVLVPDCIDIVL